MELICSLPCVTISAVLEVVEIISRFSVPFCWEKLLLFTCLLSPPLLSLPVALLEPQLPPDDPGPASWVPTGNLNRKQLLAAPIWVSYWTDERSALVLSHCALTHLTPVECRSWIINTRHPSQEKRDPLQSGEHVSTLVSVLFKDLSCVAQWI